LAPWQLCNTVEDLFGVDVGGTKAYWSTWYYLDAVTLRYIRVHLSVSSRLRGLRAWAQHEPVAS